MKNQFKKIINYILKKIIDFLFRFNFGRYFLEIFSSKINSQFKIIEYKNKKYKFYTPNRLSYFRAQTFLTKEPLTIKWIENFDEGSVFWDIGANIGLYSCFAAKEKNIITYSFEPSVFNLDMLAKNIYENNLNKNNKENKMFTDQTNINLRDNLYNSYDILLNEKYKIEVNEKTLERMKNYFR